LSTARRCDIIKRQARAHKNGQSRTCVSAIASNTFNATDKNTDCNKLFSGFSNVTNFDLTHLNTTNVESMAMMFSGCSSITSIDVSKFDTSKVRFMNSMFAGCSYLQSIDLRNFNTSKVETMSGMFAICNYLSHVNLTSFDTSSLQSTFLMFERCGLYSSNGMTILVSSRWNLDNVDVTGMFSGCVTDHVTVV